MPKIMTLSGLIDVSEVESGKQCKSGEKFNDCLDMCIPSEVEVLQAKCFTEGKNLSLWYKGTFMMVDLQFKDRRISIRPVGSIVAYPPGAKNVDDAKTTLYELAGAGIIDDKTLLDKKYWSWKESPNFSLVYKKGDTAWEVFPLINELKEYKDAVQKATKLLLHDNWWVNI